MAQPRKEPCAEDLEPLRKRIEVWRTTRSSRGQTPDEIWDSAVALARIYGVCRVARAVDLDYKALRTRVTRAPEKPGLVKPAFVELPATLTPERTLAPGTTIEISSPDGSRMRISLEAGRGMEAAGIVAAFLGSRG
jgi:hypothetical protein